MTACQQDIALTHPVTVASQDEAAAVLVSVTNVAPWEQVAATMQPNFALSGDQALLQVMPGTERMQEQVLSAFGATLGIGLPQSARQSSATTSAQTSTTTTIPANGQAATSGSSTNGSSVTSTNTLQPGVTPTPPSGMPAGGQLPTGQSVAGDVGLDPVLKYQAALALFESVQMMNREIQNAAMLRCYVPFLVRMRIAVMPYRPNLAYSLNTRIAFFPNENPTKGIGTLALRKASDGERPDPCTDARYLPYIVPILASDDIERALKSRATEVAQQIGLALSAMVQGLGGSLSTNNLNQALSSISAQDYNSRLSVARQSDNILFVRIGATQQATAGLALAAQNYDVALLLLAPRSYFRPTPDLGDNIDRQLRLVSHTQFRNAFDGSVLDDRPVATLVRQIDQVMRQVLAGDKGRLEKWKKLDDTAKEAVARKLAGPIQASQYDEFVEILGIALENTDYINFSFDDLRHNSNFVQQLWVSASTILSDTATKSAYLLLRAPAAITFSPAQKAFVFDDGKSKAQVQLQTLKGTSAATLTATLDVIARGQKYSFPAQAVNLDPVTHLLTLTFFSPTQWGINTATATGAINIAQVTCGNESLCPQLEGPTTFTAQIVKVPTSDSSPNLSLSQNVTQIAINKVIGSGSVNGAMKVAVTKLTDDSATVTVGGADVVSATDEAGTALTLANGGVIVTKDTTVTFNLMNLHNGAAVTVTAEGKKSSISTGKKTIQFAAVGGG
jgi:hypothetical protein